VSRVQSGVRIVGEQTGGGDEAGLLALARAGDRAALGTLFECEGQRVRTLLLRTLGPRAALDDLVQDVRVKAVKGIGAFRGDASFGTWLHRITMNVAVSALRRLRRTDALPDEITSKGPGPALQAERTELRERLAAAVDRLPPLMGEAFQLKYRDGLDAVTIATRLGVPAATVRTRLFHARRRLRDALDDLVSG